MNFKLVAEKIEKILNNNDSETYTNPSSNPTPFHYMVEAQGFHLDHIMNKDLGVNEIPVFISSMGGSMNPVPDLKQGNYTIPITFYYPVRFRDEIFKLDDFLIDIFVGKILNFGTSDNPVMCLCNKSIPQFGEIQGVDMLREFKSWAEGVYQKQIEVMEPYISMTVTLYLSNVAPGFVYGNEATVDLTVDPTTFATAFGNDSGYDRGDYVIYNSKVYVCIESHTTGSTFVTSAWKEINTTEAIVFVDGSIQSNAQVTSEQELDAEHPETASLPIGTAYGFSVACYYKDDDFFGLILDKWFSGDVQTLRFSGAIKIGSHTFTRTCFVQSVNMPIRKGELITVTLTFVKAVEVVDEPEESE